MMEQRFPLFNTLENIRDHRNRISIWISQVIKKKRKEDQEKLCNHFEEDLQEDMRGRTDDREKENTGTQERSTTGTTEEEKH
jgi:hypothetical protein